MRNSLGFGPTRAPMDFTERPPLVVPPSDSLPPPAPGQSSLPVVDTDTTDRRKALTDSRRPVPPNDPGAGVAGLSGRTYLIDRAGRYARSGPARARSHLRPAAQGQGQG